MWHSNRTLAMNATSLSLNASDSLANKTLIVTTILVSSWGSRGGPGGVLGGLWGSWGGPGGLTGVLGGSWRAYGDPFWVPFGVLFRISIEVL